jgi:hypothetical protein
LQRTGVTEDSLYCALATAYGRALYRKKLALKNNLGKKRVAEAMVTECRDVLSLRHQPPALSASVFVHQYCDDAAAYLRSAPLHPPTGLRRLVSDLAEYVAFRDARKVLVEACTQVATNVLLCQIHKCALQSLLESRIIVEDFVAELGEWLDPDAMVGDFATHLQYQLMKWNEAEEDCDALRKSLAFLDVRGMLADAAAAAELTPQCDRQLFLAELEALNDSIAVELSGRNGLSEESTRALKFFCSRKSLVFAKLFDTVRRELTAAQWRPEAVTAETLRRLGLLANASNAHISDLQLDLQGMVRQLDSRTSQQQKQELCMIGEYFHQDSTVSVQTEYVLD